VHVALLAAAAHRDRLGRERTRDRSEVGARRIPTAIRERAEPRRVARRAGGRSIEIIARRIGVRTGVADRGRDQLLLADRTGAVAAFLFVDRDATFDPGGRG